MSRHLSAREQRKWPVCVDVHASMRLRACVIVQMRSQSVTDDPFMSFVLNEISAAAKKA